MSHNYVSLIKDENAVQYFIHDNRFEDGVVDDTTIALSYSDNSSGCKCYHYKDCSVVGGRVQFVLCDSLGNVSDITYSGIQANDVLSMSIPNTLQISSFAKIYSVNTATSQVVIEYLENIESAYSELNQYLPAAQWNSLLPCSIWFTQKPELGDDTLSSSSVALGTYNYANGTGSLTIGENNVADGKGSFSAGEENIVGDYSASFGTNNKVLGRSSLSVGDSNLIFGMNSAAIGSGLKTFGTGQLVVGTNMQVPSSPESFSFMVVQDSGNPLMLEKTGNLYIRGDVYSKSNGNASSTTGGFKLNGVRTSSNKMYLMGTTNPPTQSSTTVENFANSQLYATDGVLTAKGLSSTQQYITVGNIKVWVSNTAPTSGVSDGDIGIGW